MGFLEALSLSKVFGGVAALDHVDLSIKEGEILGLIGPNGAGKTTFFNVLTGLYKPDKGEILFRDQRIDGLLPHEIAARGIARTFQNIRLFPNMTAMENVMVARHCRTQSEFFGSLFMTPAFRQEELDIQKSARVRCSRRWDCSTAGTHSPRIFRTAISAGWKSPARSPWNPNCFCWTSPPPG